ncbi:MAG: sugar phosphate isomerase/epimerase family protein [Desulfobacterales bacterium]|nr:sugar phosphate isomerase/epimerase family protein [Desulfobacterales bacterium]
MMNDPARSVYDEVVLFGEAQFDFVDLTIEGPCACHVDTVKLLAILERYGLGVTGHTDPCLPYAYPIQGVRAACLKELERCAVLFKKLGAPVMNIHPCYFSPPAMKGRLVEMNIEALKPIVDMAASHALTVVLENFKAPFDRVSTYERILSEVPGLKVHLDFGHANLGKDNHEVFCDRLGTYIRHVHFSDNRSWADDHMPLGVGNIDWKNAVKHLKASGYDETITLEVFCKDPNMRFQYLNICRQMVLNFWN